MVNINQRSRGRSSAPTVGGEPAISRSAKPPPIAKDQYAVPLVNMFMYALLGIGYGPSSHWTTIHQLKSEVVYLIRNHDMGDQNMYNYPEANHKLFE